MNPDAAYTCYGLTIASDLVLPEILSADPALGGAPPDVRICLGAIPADGLPLGKQLGPFLWAEPRQLWLQVPRVARFLVSEGSRITIDPEPGVDEDSIRVFLLGSALGALLFQRGLLVLHGNAIRIRDQCLLCVGHSGAGKSTLAAGFLRRGYQILADDVVPIDGDCRVLPGFPRIKLWQDAADRLDIDTSGLQRVRPNMKKFSYPLGSRFIGQPLSVRWIHILGTDDDVKDICLTPIRGLPRFTALRQHTYRVRFMDGMTLKAEHLQLCSRLAGRVSLSRLSRPEQGWNIDALVDRLLEDVAANP